MDIIESRPDPVGVSMLFKRMQKFSIRFTVFDRKAIGVKRLNGFENIVKIAIA